METTSRRLAVEKARLAASYSSWSLAIRRSRRRNVAGLSRVMRQVAQFLAQLDGPGGLAVAAGLLELCDDAVHSSRDLPQMVQQPLQSLGAQANLFDQPHRPAAPGRQTLPSLAACGRRPALAQRHAEVCLVSLDQVPQRGEMRPQHAHDPPFFPHVFHRHVHRVVQTQLPFVNLLQQAQHRLKYGPGSQQGPAKTRPAALNTLGGHDLLRSAKHGYLADLQEVDADRIVVLLAVGARPLSIQIEGQEGCLFSG